MEGLSSHTAIASAPDARVGYFQDLIITIHTLFNICLILCYQAIIDGRTGRLGQNAKQTVGTDSGKSVGPGRAKTLLQTAAKDKFKNIWGVTQTTAQVMN